MTTRPATLPPETFDRIFQPVCEDDEYVQYSAEEIRAIRLAEGPAVESFLWTELDMECGCIGIRSGIHPVGAIHFLRTKLPVPLGDEVFVLIHDDPECRCGRPTFGPEDS